MSYDLGPRIGIEGEAAYRKSIREINASTKAMTSEMKSLVSAYDAEDQSQEKLRKQNELLNRQIEAQKKKLSELSAMLEKSKVKYGEADEKTQKWKRAVNDATAELNRLDHELTDNVGAIAKAEDANTDFAKAQRKAEEAAERLRQEQSRLASQVETTSAKLQRSSDAVNSVNKAAAIATVALASLSAVSTKVGMGFEAQMSRVEATSGATAEEMEILNDAAKEMGETTEFSARQSGQALEYMSMAGWKTKQMVAGLPGVINLAAASGEDLGTASDIVTDALTAFGLQAKDSSHFADVLAKASSSANTNVSMMGETFKYAAPVAGSLGYNVKDVAVAIGLMANAGIKGQKSGTALRSIFTNLAKPSKENAEYMKRLSVSMTDANGAVKPLNNQLVDLRKKFADLTESQKAEYAAGIAGKEAMSGLLAIVNTSDTDFNKLASAIGNSDGAAKQMAETANRNLKGELKLLSSAAEGVGIAFYEKIQGQASEAVVNLTEKVSKFSRELSDGELDDELAGVAAGAVAAGTALVGLNATMAAKDLMNFAKYAKLVKTSTTAMEAYKSATIAGTLAQKAFNLTQSVTPWGWAAIAAAAATTAYIAYESMTRDATAATKSLSERIEETTERLNEQTEAQEKLSDARANSISDINLETSMVEEYVDELRDLTNANGEVNKGCEMRAQYLAEQINNLVPNAVEVNHKEEQSIYAISDAIEQQIFEKKKALVLEAMQDEYVKALKDRKNAEMELTSAYREQGEAQQVLEKAKERLANIDPIDIGGEDAKARLKIAEEAFNTTTETVETARKTVEEYQKTLNSVNAITLTENSKELEAVISGLSSKIVKNTDDNKMELEEAVASMQLTYNRMVATAAKSWGTMSKDQKEATRKNLSDFKEALDEQVEEANAGGVNISKAVGEGVEEGAYVYPETMKEMLRQGIVELEASGLETPELGKSFGDGYIFGMTSKQKEVNDVAVSMTKAALDGIADTQDSHSPSRETRKLGLYFSEGMRLGILDGKSGVINSAIEVAQAAVKAAKEELDIHSPSRVMRDQVGIMIARGLAEGMDNGIPLAKRSAKRLGEAITEELKTLNDKLAEIEEQERKERAAEELKDYQKSIKEKYAELAKAETKEKQKILDEIAKLQSDWNDKQTKADKDALKAKISNLEAFKKEYEDAVSEIERKQESMAEKLSSYGELFTTVTNSRGKEFLKLGDLQDDIDKIEEYGDALERLKERGISDDLMGEITSMNVDDAIAYTSELLEKTPEQYDEYMKLWEEKQAAAAEVARKFYSDEFKQLQTEFVDKVPPEMEGLKSGMRDIGKESAVGLANGFWEKKPYIIATFKSVLESALQEARASMEIHSPSRKWAEVGSYMALGLGVGFTDQMREVSRQISNSIPVPTVENRGVIKAVEGGVNAMASVMQSGTSGQPIRLEIPVQLPDGKALTRLVVDDLGTVLKQRGVRLG